MMKRNRLGSTVIVFCDNADCGACWSYDAYCATFRAARRAAVATGWECIRTPEIRRDTCRWCAERSGPSAPSDRGREKEGVHVSVPRLPSPALP